MRKHALLVFGLLLALGGCGGGGGKAHVVRVTAIDLGARSRTVTALPKARANGREAPLEAVLSLVPRRLPDPGGDCNGTGFVEVVISNGRRVHYGSCRPRSIDRLQLALTGEARQWRDVRARAVRIAGATPRQERALRDVLREVRPATVSTIRLGPAERLGMSIRVQAAPSVRGAWEGALVAGRYAAVAAERGLAPLVTVFEGSDGITPARPLERGRALDVAHYRRAVAALVGGRARIVESGQEGAGLVLVVRAADPASFLAHDGLALTQALRRPRREYVGVEDAAGALVYAWARTPTEGSLYARPDLDACGPIQHSVPFGYRQLPCRVR